MPTSQGMNYYSPVAGTLTPREIEGVITEVFSNNILELRFRLGKFMARIHNAVRREKLPLLRSSINAFYCVMYNLERGG